MQFSQKFKTYSCAEDSIRLEHSSGITFVATLEHDTDTRPTDFDCYTPEQIRDWKNDEWRYVGIVVTALFEGIEIDTESTWGCECNLNGNNDGLNEVANEDLNNLAGRVVAKLSELVSKLSATLEKVPTGWDMA